jgi:hypothetical protein
VVFLLCGCPQQRVIGEGETGTTEAPEGTSTSTSTSTSTTSTSTSTTSTSSTSTSTTGGSSSDDGTTGVVPPTDPGCPECIVLVDELESGRGIAVDATHVYLTDQARGTVERVMKNGGDGGSIADSQDTPYDIDVDETHVYWTNNAEVGSVMRVAKDGGAPELVAEETLPRAIEVVDGTIYWSTFDEGTAAVRRRPTSLAEEASSLAYMYRGVADIAIGPTDVFFTSHSDMAGAAFIVDPMEPPIGGVFSVARDGSDDPFIPVLLDDGNAEPWGVAFEGGDLFWANGSGRAQYDSDQVRVLAAGAPDSSTLAGDQAGPWGIAADATHVYWTDSAEVKAIPREGGATVVLATEQNVARYITVDETHVFWITRNRVLQHPKL